MANSNIPSPGKAHRRQIQSLEEENVIIKNELEISKLQLEESDKENKLLKLQLNESRKNEDILA